jgi:hypothetical protein
MLIYHSLLRDVDNQHIMLKKLVNFVVWLYHFIGASGNCNCNASSVHLQNATAMLFRLTIISFPFVLILETEIESGN